MIVSESDIELLRNSKMFNAEWYLSEYPDVAILGMDPIEHYLKYGAKLNRRPSEGFDPQSYIASNDAVARREMNPLLHFLKSGKSTSRLVAEFVQPLPNGMNPNKNELDDIVAAVRGSRSKRDLPPKPNGIPTELTQQYALISSEFDGEFYLRRYGDIARSKTDPVKHYIEHGGRELRFPRADFDAKYYVSCYADVKKSGVNPFLHYLAIGRYEGRMSGPLSPGNAHFDEVAAMLGIDPDGLADMVAERKADIRDRLNGGELGKMVSRAAELDPLIKHSWLAALDPSISPVRSEQLLHQAAAMRRLQESAGWRRATAVVVIPWVHVSGATRIAGHLAVALASIYGPDEVVVVRTETSEMQFPEWFPDGCRHIDFASAVEGMSQPGRQRLLVEYLRSLRPAHVFNVNSRTMWEAMDPYGLAMKQTINLYAYLFCNEKNVYGDWVGYPVRNFHLFADVYQGVICDSHFLMDDLNSRFLVPPEQAGKLTVFETPISHVPEPVGMPVQSQSRRSQIFWAGRFDRQKRIDVTYEIARRMPEADFHLWGEPVLDREFKRLNKPDNVYLKGVYQNFYDLPLDDCDVWLYTSEWDGVPNMLIEVASVGLPLVGSLAGGTEEVLVNGLSKPIANIEDADAYVAALRQTIEKPREAREAALELRRRMIERRSSEVYRDKLKSVLDRENSNG